MKSMFIAGALLMTGAAIYGFIEYKKVSQRTAFRNMYQEENKGALLRKEDRPATRTADFNEKTAPVKMPGTGSRISMTVAGEKNNTGVAGENTGKKGKKKNREFEIAKFSRAPLRDGH